MGKMLDSNSNSIAEDLPTSPPANLGGTLAGLRGIWLDESDTFILEKFKRFLHSLKSSNGTVPAGVKTVDDLFNSALELEEIFLQEEKTELKEVLCKNYPNFNFSKPVDVVMENIIKNQLIDEYLTLYAINKYTALYSKEDLCELVKRLSAEVELREQLFNIIEENPDVDLDLYRLNTFLCEVQSDVHNAVKSDISLLLISIKHAEFLTAQTLMDEMIACLESQSDLKLWFLLMQKENIETVLDLCATYSSFLNAALKFFDAFAEEVESNYDEELSIQYSNVNLDFEEFVKILQLFLNKEEINKAVSEFLDSKNLTKKNFLFWVDVKSCL